jgi:hypothetical protein
MSGATVVLADVDAPEDKGAELSGGPVDKRPGEPQLLHRGGIVPGWQARPTMHRVYDTETRFADQR